MSYYEEPAYVVYLDVENPNAMMSARGRGAPKVVARVAVNKRRMEILDKALSMGCGWAMDEMERLAEKEIFAKLDIDSKTVKGRAPKKARKIPKQ
jgi:hypothetical protein